MKGVLILAIILSSPALFGQSQCGLTFSNQNANTDYSAINYVPVGYEPFGNTLEAIDVWAFGCAGSGTSYPSLTTSGSYDSTPGTMNIYVFYTIGRSTDPNGGRCGYTNVQIDPTTCAIISADIHMFQYDSAGNSCEGTMVDLVAHEIGHTLGLADVDYLSACNGTIMGSNPSYVSSDQCDVVNNTWYPPQEYQHDHVNDICNQQCQDVCYDGQCGDTTCFTFPDGNLSRGCTTSPLLLNLEGHGYHLSGVDNGVHFDLNADGTAEQTAWTLSGSHDAFLCLDRNHNGIIDSGLELFGNHTPLSTGAVAANGFDALAEFDSPALGGNGNGWIDSDDAIWPYLRLWIDTNHDGVSQSRELFSLEDAGVVRIDTHYYQSRRRDANGNQFRYRGRSIVRNANGATHEHLLYDVFFISRPPTTTP